jgi:hypothetical protein
MSFRFLLFGLLGAATLPAAPAAFTSGPERVSLVELYTSEGCSSCPPAERFLASFRSSPELWRTYVPISFHVDYWNGGGWTDRLSTAAFTQRQYAYGQSGTLSSIYTPCFMVDGHEWEPRGRLLRPKGRPGILRAELGDDGFCRVSLVAPPLVAEKRTRFFAHAALLAGGLTSRVTGGENEGRTLGHEFVVLRLSDGPLARSGSARLEGELNVDLSISGPAPRRALAVWVTRSDELTPLQATGGWIDVRAPVASRPTTPPP